MKLYDVPGVDRPLMLDEDFAAQQGYSEHKPEPDVPKSSASKAEWVAYAIGSGADADYVATLTKAELVEQYGG